MKTTKLSNGIKLYACSMGKLFRVTHICQGDAEANAVMERNRDAALIAEADEYRLLAEQYGSVAPSSILKDCEPSSNQYCHWSENEDGWFNTECHTAFEFTNGGPKDNQFKFCPHCGKLTFIKPTP